MYDSVVRLAVKYVSETWTLTVTDEERLRSWERKIPRKIYGVAGSNGAWRIRTNSELESLCQKPDMVQEIKTGRVKWQVMNKECFQIDDHGSYLMENQEEKEVIEH